ncbi:acetyl CoA synthetase subunit alpha [Picosynechococcus sp. PCC 7003]|uniref:bifunctional acetate--CoA ligase family protein/GNAT family N-acetyltransferase n=1 Tax=Picosynechococcus sp. PCC 7003 TaxID=374981 RepID=UPI000810A508|nr:bifunctional acetate--CoA ligase family protein/GNAT family N-acetyltransferase [Picosynechococcus sp. PCC 7003]ANV84667.1 acetyl CoA synthetase subunit alpha [Picosynechococcus sp. PCC 7003]
MSTSPLTITIDPAYDILRSEKQPLSYFFNPKSVAIIGATDKEGSVGRTLLWNLISNPFGGTVYPVNPKRNSVLGVKAYKSIAEVPEPVELAVIAIPARLVPTVVQECVDVGVKAAIIISAGFKEIGEEGKALEKEIMAIAAGKLRIIGPNCLGLMNPHSGLNATFAHAMAQPGHVGFISQSGAFCTAVLDWSFPENVGFSAFISLGSMLDVDWGDLITYLGDDPNTKSIVIYMESVGNARSFLSAAREVAIAKPIIVIKAGRTEAAAKASASHTGSLAGSDAVLDAAFRRCGVLRVDRISELFNLAEILAKQPRLPKKPKLTIITNAGGPGVLATDAIIQRGGELSALAPETIAALDEFLPSHWSHSNPIDILGDAEPERYAKTLDVAIKDPNSAGFLVILTPQSMTDPTATAIALQKCVEKTDKPVIASWMGGDEVTEGELFLNRSQVPTYRYPDSAAYLFQLLWRYKYTLEGIYETPTLAPDTEGVIDRHNVNVILESIRAEGRTLLTESESKKILAAYGIPIVLTGNASTPEMAIALAEELGYPVVLKLLSTTITHKTDVGGVELNLNSAENVAKAFERIRQSVTEKVGAEHFHGVTVQPMLNLKDGYELILGSSIDRQFGPVMVFGTGGQLVEVFQDRAIALPPLNSTLARRTIEQTKIYQALKGVRGRKAVNLDELEQILVRFSRLIVEQPWIKEMDINPLFASGDRLVALDARIVLHPLDLAEKDLPKPAIRPYPLQYEKPWTSSDEREFMIRPIRPEDEPMLVQFHKTLSEQSVYFRYFHLVTLQSRVAHERLTRLCFIDYDREMALVAEYTDPDTQVTEVYAIARLSQLHGTSEGEFAMIVSDPIQRQGLGTELLRRLVEIGRNEGLTAITADILSENKGMQRVAEKAGFTLKRQNFEVVKATLDLTDE